MTRKPLLCGIFAVYISVFLPTSIAGAQPADKDGGPPAAPVSAAEVAVETVEPRIDLVGTSLANRVSRLASESSGRVLRINFAEGRRVEDGEALVQLDAASLRLALAAARAETARTRIQLREARRDLKRSASLVETKAISAQKFESDEFRVENLVQAVAAAEAETERIRDSLDRMTVRAPFAGYVTAKHTETGQWLSPGAPVATLVDLSVIKVRAPLPERYINQIETGDRASVLFDALGGLRMEGRVAAIIPQADEGSRSFPVEVTLENKTGELKAGLHARVSLFARPRRVLLAPKDALVLDEMKASVFVVREGKALPVPVRVGEAHGDKVEVDGDLTAGDLVVVQGNERLRPEQEVRVISGRGGAPAE